MERTGEWQMRIRSKDQFTRTFPSAGLGALVVVVARAVRIGQVGAASHSRRHRQRRRRGWAAVRDTEIPDGALCSIRRADCATTGPWSSRWRSCTTFG